MKELQEKVILVEKRKIEEEERLISGPIKNSMMSFLLRKKRYQIRWYTTKFILDNVYSIQNKSKGEVCKKILNKPPHLRNLFDMRYLQKLL
jgi:hypothetical protein